MGNFLLRKCQVIRMPDKLPQRTANISKCQDPWSSRAAAELNR